LPESEGNPGNIFINTNNISVFNGAQISAVTFGKGNAGNINIFALNSISFDGQDRDGFSSGVFSSVEPNAIGNAGSINITGDSLAVTNNAELFTGTFGQGKGGELIVNVNFLNLDNDGVISSESSTAFDAGNINLNIANSLQTINSKISTRANQSTGGNLTITAGDIQLRGDSDIRTDINSGEGGGGNINLTADSIIAFDDSDIFAFAADGKGGNIILDTPAYFAENFTLNSLDANPEILDNNNRADVNATGAVSGAVSIPDVSFIQNSLNDLPDNSINTDELVANSCVSPVGNRQEGKFIITGTGGLPVRPGNGNMSDFATGEVRNVPINKSGWQRGDAIVEPQGMYRLANSKLVLSRECSR
jgi:large exoprotein involved in heme utilization and adhesion